ncbi:SERPINE1 mRNA binding protein 1 [Willisornis vidua]|uniref:SERPINE1 mRNA binding protein 1 n=1 Tax=Willisornis vidua TaxID=1566151 RepID=A0ABQ9DMA8_9PASS|nr:SERPINE1 mRNA binding protein 1 [Willisornis vidua]
MPGHLQEGFGCVVTNRFDQLFDDESDPFEVLRAAESRRKESGGGGGGGGSQAGGGGARGPAGAQSGSSGGPGGAGQAGGGAGSAAKQLRRESQKERKNPLPPFAGGDRREDGGGQPGAPLRKEGIRRIGRRPDQQQQQQQQQQGEGKPIDRRPERRPPRERRFEKPAEDKGEGGEFSVDKPIIDRPMRGRGGLGRGRGRGRGMGRGDGFDSRGKREFDRHSGSDRSENEVEEVKEEGPKEMTLDEWKAIQSKDRAKVEFNIRKPNEGADGQWKKGFVLHKSKSEELVKEFDVIHTPNQSSASAPDVDDPEAFPALS